MARQIPWTKSVNAKLGAVLFLLLGISVVVSAMNVVRLAGMRGDAAKQMLFGEGTTYAYQVLAYTWRLPWETGAARDRTASKLKELAAANAQRYQVLLNGDPANGIPPVTNPAIKRGNTR